MWNKPDKQKLDSIPRIYETENVPLKNKLIHLHFFIGGCDWYIAEYDGEDLFFGYAILNGDLRLGEWGYINFSALMDIKVGPGVEIDCDLHWKIRKASEVEKIQNIG